MKNAVHFIYIIIFLIITIILLIVSKFGNQSQLVNYVSFALTLTSLILGLISIGYSFLSNTTFTNNISSINNAANRLDTSSNKISEISEVLNNRLDEIPNLIKIIENKVDSTHTAVIAYYGNSRQPEQIESFANNIIDNVLLTTSISGAFILYTLACTQIKNKSIKLEDIESITDVQNNYAYGYIVSAFSFGIFQLSDVDFTNNPIKISNMNDYLLQNIDARIKTIIENTSLPQKDVFTTRYNVINGYFE